MTWSCARFLYKNQQGAFSPFMFGLLIALGSFSMFSMYTAQKELKRLQEARAKRLLAEAEDVAKAVEFKIRTETDTTFSQDFDIRDLRQYTNQSQGRTTGDADMQIIQQDADRSFDLTNQRIAIAATDDQLTQAELYRTADAAELSRAATTTIDPIVVVDTSAVRQHQMSESIKRLNKLAEQVYQFYSGNLRFPRVEEFDELNKLLKLRDVWGNEFYYTYRNDEEALLEFRTPWNYTYSVKLSLTDN